MSQGHDDPLAGLVPDVGRLARWLDGAGFPGAGEPLEVERMLGGTANVLCSLRRGGHRWVLRRGPRRLRDASNRIMLREHRVLRALEGSGVPHPRALGVCDDDTVIGAAFHVMEHVDGIVPAGFPPPFAEASDADRRAVALEFLDALAALASVDHHAVGLDDFGKPAGFLDRQVDRWLGELASYERHEGYEGPGWEGLDDVAAWLRGHVPRGGTPGIMHGDYHLQNVLFAPTLPPRLLAVVDWEQSTIGDPLLDLGWVLSWWPDPGDAAGPLSFFVPERRGLPTRSELVERYAARTGRDVAAVDYYVVLAQFKFACILEGQHARAVAGVHDPALGELMAGVSRGLIEAAAATVRRR